MEIISFNNKRTFTLELAEEILPVIYRITEAAQKEVKLLGNRMESVKSTSPEKAKELEMEINVVVEKWQQKVAKLGGSPKGIWLADFDKGDGYYCWKFPETKISYWHGYNDGFSGRQQVTQEN